MKKIVLTGGGTAGHVTPNIALLPALRQDGYEVFYIGSRNGMEKKLIGDEGIPYYGISSGKLRRYFSWKNFSDPFRVIGGYFESIGILRKIRPDVIFSKGGFVSVPVVLAAKALRIPAVIHESDMTPGLANRIALKGAVKVCCNFPETLQNLPAGKAVLTGTPIRQSLFTGERKRGLDFAGLSGEKPVLLVIGGSQGSVFVNKAVRAALPEIQKTFDVIHLCGKGNLDTSLTGRGGYAQFEYISDELPDLFAAADLVISRAGANAVCEILALQKPNILIPLSRNASRGDQILNARSFEKQGFSRVLEEESVTPAILAETVSDVFENRESYIAAMKKSHQMDSIDKIVSILDGCITKKK